MTSITAFRENREGKNRALSQQMHSVITALALRGTEVLPLTPLASVLGTSGGGVTQPGPGTFFSPSPWSSSWQCALSSVAAEEPCLPFPHISALPEPCVTGSLQACGAKKWMCPHEVFLPKIAVAPSAWTEKQLTQIQFGVLLFWLS